jgi:hypothetical protein
VLIWVTVAAAIADVVLVSIAAKRHWAMLPALGHEIAKQLDPRFGRAAESEARERLEKIRAELVGSGSEAAWSGEYYEGDGTGVNIVLSLAPQSGFVFEWEGCLGVYDRNFGTVAAGSDRIELAFHYFNLREQFRGLSPVFIPVQWGERRYLVPPEKIDQFCTDANSGDEPRDSSVGFYLLRLGDEKKAARGLPDVPGDFGRLLLRAPLEPKIIEVLDSWKHDTHLFLTRVRLDMGSDRGVVPGMRMSRIESEQYQRLVIENVSEQSCTAIVQRDARDDPLPAIGWKFSSKIWHR